MRKNWEQRVKQVAIRKTERLRAWLRAVEEEVLGPRHPQWRSW